MFIARTQLHRAEGQPRYRLSRGQKPLWRKVLALARERAALADSPAPTNGEERDAGRLSGLPEACLWFCLMLLGQIVKKTEYESPMICALAVLGMKPGGWKDVHEYPPILSEVIKISRFMVVQAGYQSAPKEDEREEEEESGGDDEEEGEGEREGEGGEQSEVESRRGNGREGGMEKEQSCLEWVTGFMDEFMVRGCQSPVQWMLDLRTYGLKIHYNTTGEGHVAWDGDRILYKSIQFTMDEFRTMVYSLIYKI